MIALAAWSAFAIVAMIDAVFLAEIFAGLVPHKAPVARRPAMPDVALLVPAHNEAAAMQAELADGGGLAALGVRTVVVADNCTDATASIAREIGFDVIERSDPTRRGKGYALAFGRDHLRASPPEVVIVLDADCATDRASVERLAIAALESGRPVQATYLFRPAPEAQPSVQISNFAFAVKNLIRQRGLRRIGAAAALTGSGMAFPWPLFRDVDLATGNVVEDLALGIDMICDGHAPRFEEAALIWSSCSDGQGTQTQRSRWEGGFLATARHFAPHLLATGLIRADWKRLWMGLHLLVPPLSLLVAINLVLAVSLSAAALLGSTPSPAIAAFGLLVLLVLAVGLAWAAEGRRHVGAGTLLRLPAYLVWKLALFARIVSGRQSVAWTRTDRTG